MPEAVSAELRRVADRWHRLPVDRARAGVPHARLLIDDLATATAPGQGPVPDLGPAAVPDQLAVLVHDACRAGVPGLEERLAALRRLL